jgi:hypothetical protein
VSSNSRTERNNGLIRTEIALICTNDILVIFLLNLNSASALFERTRIVKSTHVSRTRDATMLRILLNAVVNGGEEPVDEPRSSLDASDDDGDDIPDVPPPPRQPRPNSFRTVHNFPMTIGTFDAAAATRVFTDRGYDMRRVVPRRQRSFGNTFAGPRRNGTRVEYVCTEHHRHCCNYKLRLTLYQSGAATIDEPENNQHVHVQRNRPNRVTATREQKDYLDAMIRAGATPAHMFQSMQQDGLVGHLDARWIVRYVGNNANKVRGIEKFIPTFGNFERLFDAFPLEDAPSDAHAGVVFWEMTRDQPCQLQLIMSSKDLLRKAVRDEPHMHVLNWAIDGTYKLNRANHVVLVFGTQDLNRSFHLCAFAVVPSEAQENYEWFARKMEEYLAPYVPNRPALRNTPKTRVHLIADGAPAVGNGMRAGTTQRDIVLGMCYYHLTANIKKYKSRLEDEKANYEVIKRDLQFLHQIPYGCAKFKALAEQMWLKKLINLGEINFSNYFRVQWLGKGYSHCDTLPGFPTSNNAAERYNKHIKEAFRYQTATLAQCIEGLAKLIEREPARAPAHTPTYPEIQQEESEVYDRFYRNHVLRVPNGRVVMSPTITLYPTQSTISKVDAQVRTVVADDEQRAARKAQMFHFLTAAFMNFYQNTMVSGNEPLVHGDINQFATEMTAFDALFIQSRAFHVVQPLPADECNETIHYSCSCAGTKYEHGYQFQRKCKHVYCEGIANEKIEYNYRLNLLEGRRQAGRQAHMPPALVRQPVNDLVRMGLPVGFTANGVNN